MSLNIQFLPGNLILESAYAVSEPRTRHPKVAATEMMIVLKIYLDIGTHVLFMLENRSMKFCIVGFITYRFGGVIFLSPRGLNAVIIRYHIGRNIKIPSINSITVMPASPPFERLRTTL